MKATAVRTAAPADPHRKSYRQYCSLAMALDRVGERWTMLILRELFAGPKRFSDLEQGLPGIGSAILTRRLSNLLADGLILRHSLPVPAASVAVYELTERGRALDPVMSGLARWAIGDMTVQRRGYASRPRWLLQALAAAVASPDGRDETINFIVDGQEMSLTSRRGRLVVRDGCSEHTTATVTCQSRSLRNLLLAPGGGQRPLLGLSVDGDRAAVERLIGRLSRGGAAP